jgi:RNA polymerase sigma-70 factor (ECF subfamily)
VETFAHRITVRVAYRYFARAPRERELQEETHEGAERPQDELVAERQGLARLYRCLAKLSEKRRTAFVLCAIEGLSPQEAAALVGTSAGSMRSRYKHARDELARLLGSQEQGGTR